MSATLAPRAQSLVPPSSAPKQSLATISPKDAAAALAAMEAPVEAQFQPPAYGVDKSGFVNAGETLSAPLQGVILSIWRVRRHSVMTGPAGRR